MQGRSPGGGGAPNRTMGGGGMQRSNQSQNNPSQKSGGAGGGGGGGGGDTQTPTPRNLPPRGQPTSGKLPEGKRSMDGVVQTNTKSTEGQEILQSAKSAT